ncbi:MAG TPA: hypothetical protein VGB77_14955 [Abditibacteriaceae bacterium]|jgi:hypothetical protein
MNQSASYLKALGMLATAALLTSFLGGCGAKDETVKGDSNGPNGSSVLSTPMDSAAPGTVKDSMSAPANGGAGSGSSAMK